MKRSRKQKKPKALRFSRYFFRALIPCLLAAGIFAAYSFNAFRVKHEDYADEDEKWFKETHLDEEKMQSYAGKPARIQLTDREFEAQYGMNRLSYMLTKIIDCPPTFIGRGPAEYSALLIDPETGEIYLPKQTGMLILRGGSEYSQDYREAAWLSDEAEAERLIKEYYDYANSRSVEARTQIGDYICDLLENILPFGGVGSALGETFDDWMEDGTSTPVAVHSAYVKDHQFRGVTCQLPDGTVISPEEEMQAPWKLLKSRLGMTESELAVVNNYDIDDAEKPENIFLNHFYAYGLPTDAIMNKAMQEIVKDLKQELPSYQEVQQQYRDIINDESGVMRKEYYMERRTHYDDVDGDGTEDIPTPEVLLQNWIENTKRLPARICSGIISDVKTAERFNFDRPSPLSADEWKSLRYASRTVTLDGKDYGLFYIMKSRSPWDYYLPTIILNCILLLIGALLLALILALIPYRRAKRRYARDEYRRSLTASLAHDLKSPLTAISGYAENLASDVHPEKQAHYAESIQDSTRYMDSLITNVLNLAKLEQDEEAKKGTADMIALAREHLQHRMDEIEARGMRVTVTGRTRMYADQRMLSQAVQNLLDNALKFTPDGGSITVTGGWQTLCISNQIKEERIGDVDRLCEAFVKGDSARSNQSGSGLGLSVVQQIARLNKLRFTVESRDHRFITVLSGTRRARRNGSRAERKANRMVMTDLAALMKQQMNVTEQDTGILFRDVKWKVTGSCRLYARKHDTEEALALLAEHALNCVPDGAEITVEGDKHTLRIVHPADRKRMSKEESDMLLKSVKQLVKRSRLRFSCQEQNGQLALIIHEQPLLFRPLHFR